MTFPLNNKMKTLIARYAAGEKAKAELMAMFDKLPKDQKEAFKHASNQLLKQYREAERKTPRS
jgi:hypothetical protein